MSSSASFDEVLRAMVASEADRVMDVMVEQYFDEHPTAEARGHTRAGVKMAMFGCTFCGETPRWNDHTCPVTSHNIEGLRPIIGSDR